MNRLRERFTPLRLYCPPPTAKPDLSCPTDTNNDGVTNVLDLIDLLLQFGQACP